ncbi:class I SAM-dependent methyltransferase [Mycetocola tolaasinivorans]|nr:class I SAM-dependent methyltransferase [Mycetocola tolaasinivorans]
MSMIVAKLHPVSNHDRKARMTHTAIPTLDTLISEWEAQQEAYIRHRSQRFEVVLDALGYRENPPRTVLDLGGGLGSFSRLILERFPDATVITLDADPALLEVARHNLAPFGTRSIIHEVNLRDPRWSDVLGGVRPDVAVSSTALHWLPNADLVALYGALAGIIVPGGIVLNADHFAGAPAASEFTRLAEADDAAAQRAAFSTGTPNWDEWWSRLGQREEFGALITERDRRFATIHDDPAPTAAFHVEALRIAGFREAGTLWQYLNDYVAYGVRG